MNLELLNKRVGAVFIARRGRQVAKREKVTSVAQVLLACGCRAVKLAFLGMSCGPGPELPTRLVLGDYDLATLAQQIEAEHGLKWDLVLGFFYPGTDLLLDLEFRRLCRGCRRRYRLEGGKLGPGVDTLFERAREHRGRKGGKE